MQLFNKDKAIEITINVPTRTARRELRKLDKKQGEQFDKLNKEYADVVELNSLPPEDRAAKHGNDPELAQRTFDYVDKIADISEEKIIEKFQAIIRSDKLSDVDRNLVLSKPSSEFWMSQDIEEVQVAVNSFRRGAKPGRPEDQSDT